MTSDKQILSNQRNASKSTGPRTESGKSIVSRNSTTHGLRSQQVVIAGESQAEYDDFRDLLIARMSPADPLEAVLVDRVASCAWRLRRSEFIEAQIYDNLREDIIAAHRKNTPDPLLITVPADHSAFCPGSSAPDSLEVRVGLALKSILEKYLESESNPEVASTLLRVEETIKYHKEHPNTIYIPGLMQFLVGLRDISEDSDFLTEQDTRDLDKAIEDLSRIQAGILHEDQPNIGHAVSEDFASNNILSKFTRYEKEIQGNLFKTMRELQRLQEKRNS